MTDHSNAESIRHVFVYGTLRRGQRNDIARIAVDDPAPILLGFASIDGAMFDLGEYPGAILGTEVKGSAQILGEVYRVTPDVELRLDVLEELLPEPTGEYFKREIEVGLSASPDGAHVEGPLVRCFVYEINGNRVTEARVIAHGDWAAYERDRK